MKKLDTQQIELIGNGLLEAELIKRGYEVARPNRDLGIDLIVYTNGIEAPFSAVPIQVKNSTKTAFGAFRKYEKFQNLIFAYVWNVLDKPRFFIMTYEDTVTFVPDLEGFSWQNNKKYTWSTVPKNLEKKLKPFEDRWDIISERLNILAAVSATSL